MDHGHTCRYIPWFKTMYRQAIEINRSNLSECTPSSTTLDLDSLHRFPVGKRKFQRTRTSFVTGQIVVLERGTYLIYFVSKRSIFQIFWKPHSCPDFLLLELGISKLYHRPSFDQGF